MKQPICKIKILLPILLLFFAVTLPICSLTVSAEEGTAKATVKSAVCSVECWEGEGVENLIDGNDATYMNPTTKTYTLKIELDGYYRLTGFRWYALEGFYPYGEVSVSLNGGSFTKWADFAFEYVVDPVYGAGFVMNYSGEAQAKFILVNVMGGPQEAVAARDFSLYGAQYTPERVDPEGLVIAEKREDGAYNTAQTACDIGATFMLNAVQTNPDSIEKVVWTSKNTAMIAVDEFGRVTVLRGGIQPCFTVTAKVVSPDGKEYSDEIAIYVKPVTNIAPAGKLGYANVGYYWRPQMAFDGVTSTFDNWVQPVAGVEEYFMECDFNQEIKFGKVAIHVAVSAPREIEVLGKKTDGTYERITTFTNIRSQSVLEISGEWNLRALRFNVRETKTGMSTIYEIEIFNHEDFSLSDIKQTSDVTENRGPTASGVYVPEKNTGESANGSYGEKFTREPSDATFIYVEETDGVSVALTVCACIFAFALVGIAVLFGLTINSKKRK